VHLSVFIDAESLQYINFAAFLNLKLYRNQI